VHKRRQSSGRFRKFAIVHGSDPFGSTTDTIRMLNVERTIEDHDYHLLKLFIGLDLTFKSSQRWMI
jgi:hypothetical protein